MSTVLITGASRGIGRGLALAFAREGYNIIATCRKNFELLQSLQKEINDLGRDCIIKQGELSQEECEDFTCDILINNAALSYVGLMQDMTNEDIAKLVDSNISLPLRMIRNVLPNMLKKNSGLIINISSTWGEIGASCEVAYSASKAALNTATLSLGKELEETGISVICFQLGMVDTDMNNNLSAEEKLDIATHLKNGKLQDIESIAKNILDVVKLKRYVNGCIIDFDNGLRNL